jgi:copper chaperone CopZ
MNKLLAALLLAAGMVAALVALRSKEPTYSAPAVAEQPTVPSVLSRAPAADELVHEFEVEGMCCGGCAPKVYAAISKAAGVREAAVTLGHARVIARADVDVAALEQVMTFGDYQAHAVR